MPSLNITHYIIGGLFLVVLGLGIAYKVQSTKLELAISKYDVFVSETAARGLAQELENTKDSDALRQAAVSIQENYNAKVTDYNKLYGNYNKLRKQASASSSQARNLSEAASNINCPGASPKFSTAMGNLEEGILERLVKPLDICLIRAGACKDYVESLDSILGEPHGKNNNTD